LVLDVREQQIVAHGHPDLSQHRLGTGSEEGFNLQVLFNPFEEQLALPSGLVDISNGFGRQLQIVGHKRVFLPRYRIHIAHQPQFNGIFLSGIVPGQFDEIVADYGFILYRYMLSGKRVKSSLELLFTTYIS